MVFPINSLYYNIIIFHNVEYSRSGRTHSKYFKSLHVLERGPSAGSLFDIRSFQNRSVLSLTENR